MGIDGSRAVPDARDDQRVLAAAVRGLLRLTVGRTIRAGRPVERQRRGLARLTRLTRAPSGLQVRAGVCGSMPGEWLAVRDGQPAERAVLYLHGGGYCVGSSAGSRPITANLAKHLGARVFAVDYRLAPEHPFPAAIEDAVAAYRGLLAAGFPPGAAVIAGDSAGGGLAMATAVRLRDLDVPPPAALVLFSPWVDLSLGALGPPPHGEVVITRPWLAECASWYLAGHDPEDPLASPVGADLRGLPPTLIQVGSDELLLTDARRLHAALLAADVDAVLQEFPRRWHVFQANAGLLKDADRALVASGEYVLARAAAAAAA